MEQAVFTVMVSWNVEAGWLYAVYTRNAGVPPGAALRSQVSKDMEDWQSFQMQERILYTESGIDTVEARFPLGADKQVFFRLNYSH